MAHSGPFTIAEVTEEIAHMQRRLKGGQGGKHSAMCRLSLPMAKLLLAEVRRLQKALARAEKILRDPGVDAFLSDE